LGCVEGLVWGGICLAGWMDVSTCWLMDEWMVGWLFAYMDEQVEYSIVVLSNLLIGDMLCFASFVYGMLLI
jgi:hypothetical protein